MLGVIVSYSLSLLYQRRNFGRAMKNMMLGESTGYIDGRKAQDKFKDGKLMMNKQSTSRPSRRSSTAQAAFATQANQKNTAADSRCLTRI